MIKDFEELRIWQDAKALTLDIYQSMRNNKDYGFRDQIQRASVSIMNNIAEGFDAGSNKLFLRYLHIAKGSCSEVRSMIILGEELGYFAKGYGSKQENVRLISKGIGKLINHLERGEAQ